MFNNKIVLITGGTGSFGQNFLRYLLRKYKLKKIIIFSRDEFKQFKMRNDEFLKKFKNIRYFIGDIRDKERLNIALKDVDYIVHTAALKHVDISEYNGYEFIKTNILGTQNIIEASVNNNVKKIISLSTDKASSPVNLYGATKLCADKLITSAKEFYGNVNTKFSVVRYGNVSSSNGSVIPFFKEQIENKNEIPLTDPNMTRFNITLSECALFVDKCFNIMQGSEIFIPKMPSYKLSDLIKVFNKDVKIKIIGKKIGEKTHEELISIHESENTIEFKDYFVIFRSKNQKLINNYLKKNNIKKYNEMKRESYSSDKNKIFLSRNDIKKLFI